MKEAHVDISIPRWYQDLSIPQMQNVFSLADIIRTDYAERMTSRTQRALDDMGVTSTFVKITSEQIKQLRRLTKLDPVKFLCEIYRVVTGKYFTDEEYKKTYDCNERIILSAIAFLTLPGIVVELHRRLPMGVTPKFPSKPVPHLTGPRKRAKSSYLEPLFTRPDWLTYKKELHLWRKKCESIPVPRVILPPFVPYTEANGATSRISQGDEIVMRRKEKQESYQRDATDKDTNYERENEKIDKDRDAGDKLMEGEAEFSQQQEFNLPSKRYNEIGDNVRTSKRGSREKRESGRKSSRLVSQGEKKTSRRNGVKNKLPVGKTKYKPKPTGKVKARPSSGSSFRFAKQKREQSRIEDTRLAVSPSHDDGKRAYDERRSNRDEKETHFIVTGVAENDDLQNFPISHKTSGIAYVTPANSDEDFFQALNLQTKKSYPRGRENLSRKWQEWFHDVDEEFMSIAKEANKIIESVETTLKLTGPEPVCDGCCSCRQTRKANVKYHSTKTPRMVIDSITMNGERNKYVIGSLSMNLPAPSPSESMTNVPEVIDSHDKIIKNKIIGGVTNQQGNVNYHINGVIKHVERVPKKTVTNSSQEKTIRNVPPCRCNIEKMINEGLTEITSNDNIPWTKQAQICIGKKYRPREIGASSCRDYPNDKSCRRNPFKKTIDERVYGKLRGEENRTEDTYPVEKKNMYSLAAFQPCGDEDGMAVCGGPWGAVNIPDEEELARREAEAKMIRESPPCGDKPGRAICGAPFGARHPIPVRQKKDEEEDEEEPEDEEPEVKKKGFQASRKAAVESKKEKHLNRDSRCSTVASKTGRISEPTEHSSQRASKMRDYRRSKAARSDKRKKSLRDKNENVKSDEEGNGRSKSRSQMWSEMNSTDVQEIREPDKGKNHSGASERSSEMVKLKQEWNRSKILASKFIRLPVILPEDPPVECKRETADELACCKGKMVFREDETPKVGPFSWRTMSEQALPVEKTLLYLVEPNGPVETIAVRPGGKPCKCRENRNAKKVLLYNVAGITRNERVKRKEDFSRVIDGLIYITPTPSVRNSEEYIAEYELDESPYEKCSRKRKIEEFKYIEKYLGPKSLMKKQPRGSVACECSNVKQKLVESSIEGSQENGYQRKSVEKEDKNSGGKKWSRACDDEALIDFYTRCRDNVPCWLRCAQFSNDGCCTVPRRLRIKKPVCECKYERRFVKREEEKKEWLSLQARLRSHKKQPFGRLEGLSRPMQTETKLVISEVKDTSKELGDPRYCVAGVKQDRVMAPGECVLSGIGMHTPVKTPEPSKTILPMAKVHRHWSPMDVTGSKAVPENLATLQLRQSVGANGRDVVGEVTNKKVDVLFRSDRPIGDSAGVRRFVAPAHRGAVVKKSIYRGRKRGTNDFHNRTEKEDALNGKGKDHTRRRDIDDDTYQSAEKHAKSKVVHPGMSMQQFDDHMLVEASPADNGAYFSEKDNGQGQRTNAQPVQSTGSTLPPDNTAAAHSVTRPSEAANLKHLMQIELERMADEGFLFAKLPACHLMPQLQYWIMYRKGIALPVEEKKILMDHSLKVWESVQMPKKMKPPELALSKKILKNLTFDKAVEIKREMESKRATFYSNLRKSRVLLSRTMWGLMEFGKFPGVSFKRAYFTYQASKESSGFCFKPWSNSNQSEEAGSHV